MPNVVTEDGYRLFFYSNENDEPIHVHVEKGSCAIKIWVDDLEVADHYNCKQKEVKKAIQLAEKYKALILKKWHEHFQGSNG